MTPNTTEGADPLVDTSIWQTAFHRIGLVFASLLNEFGLSLQVQVLNDQAVASYEKSAAIFEIRQQAPSDYSKGITKDACSLDRRAVIASGNKTGRAYGGYDEAAAEAGSDGMLVAAEVNIYNDGGDEPNLDTPTMKIGHLYTRGGKFPGTAAAYLCGDGTENPTFHHGWVARQSAIAAGGKVWDLRKRDSNDSLFCVREDGSMILFGRELVVKSVQLASGQTMDVLTLK